MKPCQYIFFFDVDGTLYDHFEGVADSALHTLQFLKDEGHIVCLNTGRSANFIPDCITAFAFDGIVAGSGTFVEYNGHILQDITFSPAFVLKTYEAFCKKNIPFTLETKLKNYMNGPMVDCNQKKFFSGSNIDDHSQAVRLQQSKFDMKDTMCDDAARIPAHKISFYANDETLPYITEIFGNQVTLSLEKKDAFGNAYGEAIPAGCCKSNGAALLCSYLKIPYERTIAVGDGSNDMDVIAWAKIGIAMGNAEQKLKDIADYICLPLNQGGICNIPSFIPASNEPRSSLLELGDCREGQRPGSLLQSL